MFLKASTALTWRQVRTPAHLQLALGSFLSPLFPSLRKAGGVLDSSSTGDAHLVGLVVEPRELASRVDDLGSESCLWWDTSHTSVLKIGTPVATLPGIWCYRVSAGTGWSGISILWLAEIESLICNFCLSAAAVQLSEQRSASEIHRHIAVTLSKQASNQHALETGGLSLLSLTESYHSAEIS